VERSRGIGVALGGVPAAVGVGVGDSGIDGVGDTAAVAVGVEVDVAVGVAVSGGSLGVGCV